MTIPLSEYKALCAEIKAKEAELQALIGRRNAMKTDYPQLSQVQLQYGAWHTWMQLQKQEWRVEWERQQGVEYHKPFEFFRDLGNTADLKQVDDRGYTHLIEAPYYCFHLIYDEMGED